MIESKGVGTFFEVGGATDGPVSKTGRAKRGRRTSVGAAGAEGRPGGGYGRGIAPSRRGGFGGVTPEKILKIYNTLRAF